jgi:uncharacterized protein (TIGR02284 family)
MSQSIHFQATTHGTATEWVGPLIDACRETQLTFEIVAGGTKDRLLRAELLQYSGQRREFVAELIAAARKYGNQIIDPGNISHTLARQCESLKPAIDQNNISALLSECERSEAVALEAYRNAYALELPTAIHALINTHLTAIKRVRDRVQRLRMNVQSDRN